MRVITSPASDVVHTGLNIQGRDLTRWSASRCLQFSYGYQFVTRIVTLHEPALLLR